MSDTELDLGQAFRSSWEAINAYPGPAIGGFVAYYIVTFGLQAIPIVGFIAHVFISPPLMGGITILSLNIMDRRDPQILHLFDGFKAYSKWMGIGWLYYAVGIIAVVPFAVVALVVWLALLGGSTHFRGPVPSAGMLAVLALVFTVLLLVPLAIVIRWAFIFYAGVESSGTLDAFGLSASITRGRRLQLFWMLVVIGLVGVSGVVALGVGLIFTVPFAALSWAALFRQLRPLAGPEAGWQPGASYDAAAPYTAVVPEQAPAEMPHVPEESGNARNE